MHKRVIIAISWCAIVLSFSSYLRCGKISGFRCQVAESISMSPVDTEVCSNRTSLPPSNHLLEESGSHIEVLQCELEDWSWNGRA